MNQHDQITVIEHPASVLVPVNAKAVFSCTAQCTPQPCTLTGEEVVNDDFISSIVHCNQNELTLNLTIYNSEFSDTARVRCYFSNNFIHNDSDTATLEWIDGEL